MSLAVESVSFAVTLKSAEQRFDANFRSEIGQSRLIPFDLDDYKIELRVMESLADKYILELGIFERASNRWRQLNTPILSFTQKVGERAEIVWTSGDLTVIVDTSPFE